MALIRLIYREDGVRKVIEFPYKYKGKGVDYKQFDPYYKWRKENDHVEFLGLVIDKHN